MGPPAEIRPAGSDAFSGSFYLKIPPSWAARKRWDSDRRTGPKLANQTPSGPRKKGHRPRGRWFSVQRRLRGPVSSRDAMAFRWTRGLGALRRLGAGAVVTAGIACPAYERRRGSGLGARWEAPGAWFGAGLEYVLSFSGGGAQITCIMSYFFRLVGGWHWLWLVSQVSLVGFLFQSPRLRLASASLLRGVKAKLW